MNKVLSFDQLASFISGGMKMNHFCYQPVMLRVLLEKGGQANVEDIAVQLLVNCDRKAINDYVRLVKKHPGPVLEDHGIVKPEKSGNKIIGYRLMADFPSLSEQQIIDLKHLCDTRVEDFIEKRGVSVSGHNSLVPNASGSRPRKCDFCGIDPNRVESESDYCFAVLDEFPVSPLHTLVIPKRHVTSYFELEPPEVNAIHGMLEEQRDKIRLQDQSISGFNVGFNDGKDAGQTIFHAHVHLIPRREGDVAEPRGGVRGVIPQNRNY